MEDSKCPNTLILKTKENKEIIFKADKSVHELILSLLQPGLSSETNNKSLVEVGNSNYIMKFDSDTKELKLVSKDELINGKSDLEELVHPFFLNIKKNVNLQAEILKLDLEDSILLFSPHPDDEILGACGLLYKAFSENIKINIVYMTTGKTAGGVEIRQNEALNGIRKLGGSHDNLIFTSFPFYETNDRLITNNDYEHAKSLIRKINPNKIYICADVFDPNRTHKKCFEILTHVMKEEEFKNIKLYFYYSVWYWPEESEYTHILPYDYETYKMKIYAMLEHKSQIETKFMGSDPRPFYQRATARDTSFGKKYNYDYCEIYYEVK